MPAVAERLSTEVAIVPYESQFADDARIQQLLNQLGTSALKTIDYNTLPTAETRSSFNVLASVNMLRADIAQCGRILPETRQRILDEELSLVSEGMNRASRTEFVLQRQSDDLAYYKNGRWESYTGMLLTGRDVAISEATSDPRKAFLRDDAIRDLEYGLKMRALRPGQQLVWLSPYRHDIEAQYGAAFMKQCGRFPDRKMAFIYRAYCEANGNIVLQSQTLDRSDDQALRAALTVADRSPIADLDEMVAAYDTVLSQKTGGEFYAGRLGAELRENAWEAILAQRDLVEYFYTKLESLAYSNLSGKRLEAAIKRHMYGVWAAFKNRIDSSVMQNYVPVQGGFPVMRMALMEQEVNQAFSEFASRGFAMIGCGGNIEVLQGEQNILAADANMIFEGMFGKAGTDQFGALEFKCTEGHWNKRPHGKLIKSCRIKNCKKGSVGC
jgi:hypothetical protein